MRILITGITGLIGSHLADFLVMNEQVVYGVVRTRGNLQNIEHLGKAVKRIDGDVEDAEAVFSALKQSQPDVVFHMAAQSYPNASFEAPLKTLKVNIASTIHILETVRKHYQNTKVVIACSAAEYGTGIGSLISEDYPLRPVNPYGISKVAQELLGYQYWVNFGIRTYLPRFFNQAGPRQGDRTSLQSWAKQIAEAENKSHKTNTIQVGNLDTVRDFLDVRDGVRAIWSLVTKGKPGEPYNICSGKSYQMRNLLEKLLSQAQLPVTYEIDPDRMRPSDEPSIVGSNEKLTKDTGWNPAIPIEETLETILAYWRNQVSQVTKHSRKG